MKPKTIAVLMRIILIGFALCGIGLLAVAFPSLGMSLVYDNPEFSFAYVPWMTLLCVCAAPCYAILVLGWLIAGNIARGNAFSIADSKLLKAIAVIAGADSLLFLLGNIIYLFLNMNHPGVLLMSLFVVFVGAAVAVASAALSSLTSRAADIQDENSLTI